MTALTIRAARLGDEALIFELLHELAVYEKLTDKYHLTPAIIARDFLGADARCFCDLAFEGDQPVGVMNWYRTYESFAASRGLFLEDIYVREAHRGKGYGKALLAHLAARAVAEGGTHIEWFVLDWNRPSIDFYEGIGARHLKEWFRYSLDGESLTRLARS